jgi:flagellar hook-length control protein FliK
VQTPAPPPAPPEVRFAETNTPNVVTSIRSNLLPHGGTMQIRLDPPDLGTLLITVQMRDGVMNASFSAANEEAAKLLSHSMSHLKHALESTGVTVEKLQVQQASPRETENRGGDQQSRDGLQDQNGSRQEQQRREMLRRMWRRLGVNSEPLDLVA